MKIKYVVGDLFESTHGVIAHGCNARGGFASGVAGIVRWRYPRAYSAYREAFVTRGLTLGEVIWAKCPDPSLGRRFLANCITQQDFGREPGRVYISYEAVRTCISRLNTMAEMTQENTPTASFIEGVITEIGFPLIGAGLANGHWPTIAAIIEEEATNFQPIVYTLDGVIPS